MLPPKPARSYDHEAMKMRTVRRFLVAAVLGTTSFAGCGGNLEALPDVWPGAWPDQQRVVASPDAGAGIAVDLMTFNIKFNDPTDEENPWGARRAIVADLIREQQPDVVGVQEAFRDQLDGIAPPAPYQQIGVGRDDGRAAGEHAAIFYRADRFTAERQGTFWLSPTPEVPGSGGWGSVVPRICTWARLVEQKSGQAFYVYNTHFDARSQTSRALGVELIAKRIAERSPADPVVMMGDFNATEENPAVRYVLGANGRASDGTAEVAPSPQLVDAFRAVHPMVPEAGTFHRWAGRTNGRRIDFIFASPPPTAKVLDAAVLRARRGRYPSDHFPVRARVWFPAP
jgi:endonuclease/exonuclease/phosphatase family metal-dependent hydrolase